MSRFRKRCRLLLLALLPVASYAQLPSGISGSWYDPEHAGHGLSIEILSSRQALMFWYTYDPAGNPVVLYIEGRIEGRRIEGRALAPRGMRFGSFDPATLQLPAWGDVRIEFAGCDRATLSWNANGEAGGGGFGAGELPLRRLTRIAESTCTLDRAPTPMPVGKYDVRFQRDLSCGTGSDSPPRAAVDPEGRLWAMELWETPPVNGTADISLPSVPGGSFLSCRGDFVTAIGAPLPAGGGALALELRTVSWVRGDLNTTTASGVLQETATGASGNATPAARFQGLTTITLERAGKVPDELSQPLDFAALQGRYRFVYRWQFFVGTIAWFDVDAQGGICVRAEFSNDCALSGQLTPAFDGYAFFDFALQAPQGGSTPRFQGRGWLQQSPTEPGHSEVVLIGTGPGTVGFGLVGRK